MQITLCSKKHDFYWYNLTVLLIPIILTLAFYFRNYHDSIVYVPLSCGVCSLILFFNFPSLVIMLHSRPIYYDDLVIKDFNEDEANDIYDDAFRKKYQRIFRIVGAVTSSLMVVVTVELWYVRNQLFGTDSSTSTNVVNGFVVIGVIGGMLRVYYSATMMIGRFIMFILRILKRREQQKLRRRVQDTVMYELTRDGITISSSDRADETIVDSEQLIHRSSSCGNISQVEVVGFKPTLMSDIFND